MWLCAVEHTSHNVRELNIVRGVSHNVAEMVAQRGTSWLHAPAIAMFSVNLQTLWLKALVLRQPVIVDASQPHTE